MTEPSNTRNEAIPNIEETQKDTGKPVSDHSAQGFVPQFAFHDEGVATLKIAEADAVQKMFGGSSHAFANAMALHCGNIGGIGEANQSNANIALAVVSELSPRDGLEAMLATQMASIHIAMMRQSSLLAGANLPSQMEIHERIFNKLARTFAAQMEALRKHRNGGKQTVTVQHVNVGDGGQAIVGNVQTGEGRK